MSPLPALPEGNPEHLAGLVLNRPKLLLMTDYDGTLVPLRDRPDMALPGTGLVGAVKLLAAKERVALAVISGRDAPELQRMLPVEGVYLSGCHGAEIISPRGEITLSREETTPPILDIIANIAANLIENSGDRGFLVERKKFTVALHYRLAQPAMARRVVADFVTRAGPLAAGNNLELLPGKKVIEARPKGMNKGVAVRFLMSRHPGSYPLYMGDDTTDEDAFRAVRGKGAGVLVSEYNKTTAASHRLRSPEDVLRFLQIIAARC